MSIYAATWRDDARCATIRGFLSLTEAGQRAICQQCPVWLPCLNEALRGGETTIHGGLNRPELGRLQRLLTRYAVDPSARANRADARRLVNAGLPVERAAVVLGVESEVMAALAQPVPRRRRPATSAGATV
jgi:hypothetical protein